MIDDERIINADSEPGNWLSYGRTYEGQRFSPLAGINRGNVSELGLAWYRDMGSNRTMEATPIVVDGVMYVTGAWSRVYAMEVKSGEMLWSYDPQVAGEYARKTCCDVVNRGAAVYQGRVYVGALDGRLHAIDAGTGEKVWEVDTVIDRDRWYSITGAPLAAAGKVFIGNGGSELGVRGYVSAYDAETGELAWRFYTVPGDPSEPFEHPEMEMAAETWNGEWWEHGGGGTVWNSIVYDPDFDQVYLGTGNGSPWSREIRSPGGGDNLFLVSILAVDANTGRMNWYYQQVPAEDWDYTATADMALADMEVDGKMRKVLLQAPKNGFFYVLDRSDGKLLRAHPFASVTWASHVDMETGRPVENPDLHYLEEAKFIRPGPLGAHNWQAMSVDVGAGVVYLGVQDAGMVYAMDKGFAETGVFQPQKRGFNLGIELGEFTKHVLDNIDSIEPDKGYLKAFDPLTGEEKWVVELPHFWNGGVLGTAGGLVFQGDATGHVTAYDKDNGEMLWQFNAYSSILAPPVTFMQEGEQYVSIMTGSGGGNLFGGDGDDPDVWVSSKYGNTDRLLVFKLGGTEELPRPTLVDRTIPTQDLGDADDRAIASGEVKYMSYCVTCHGFGVRSGGAIPDLRRMSEGTHAIFDKIVLEGLYASNGMAAFNDVLSEQDVKNIHLFVQARAEEDRLVAAGEKEEGKLSWVQ
ncbi:MAG: PQQ-dependent dehydrogenase, methanol/ethanol family [Xanthomonadales bacterium]|nr:PQQ-dependent dehydrogenase, methanol/ethanol family [Xanthomonadales bacterium]NIX13419.1 PQQ-dependent dehydrogenase, methanol/ethanol family [Xanthomonadales bacterium]